MTAACALNSQAQNHAATEAINSTALASHIKVLASDAFEGRKPFTRGEDSSVNYIAREFKKIGLIPGNGDSYFQNVPMVSILSKPTPLVIKGNNGTMNLDYGTDFVAATRYPVPQVKLPPSEMVFAGYGIVAPEFGWNDYAGLDVKGKTVVVLINDPGQLDPALFRGKNMTYYGRWTYKFEEASRQGAAGVIIIHNDAGASYPWSVVRNGWANSKLHLASDEKDIHRTLMEGWITQDAAIRMFKQAGVSPDIMEQAKTKGFKPVDLHLTAEVVINNTIQNSTSRNVIGILNGASAPAEAIAYTAHWDHFGIGPVINGDSIYNGAVDNATGVAGLLVLANAFKKLNPAPKRSVIFVAVTGEEQGLLGSEYYVNHLKNPASIVADINLDVMNTFGKTSDVTIIGYGQSELEDYAAKVAAAQGRTIVPEAHPEGGWFFRSDHFNFAKKGIPGLYIGPGTNVIGKSKDYASEKIKLYNTTKYHTPKDEYDPETWDLAGMTEDVRLLFQVGYKLANNGLWPKWKETSEFKALRK
ncbi:M20/M25/M40 family metallo-hydrolase [Chitinophaga silvatica]|uniref:M20/M25/M40 family metallo-hydrolase n=1 Tax=Chitinophaga silvatica TaxID=2282649 RepID=A0A3E1Y9C5_9BACT|nr:M28 family metallopeptidase [Chitinophaga silvatica]RFS22005.1 M20/M25/M40 family metallo-hydrolase [Chitinophaga silvatica]